MSGDSLSIDYDAWNGHADEWDEEAQQARARMAVDPETLESARRQFGRIGSSTVGASYASVLQERQALGERLGAHAENIGAKIRGNLRTYAEQEAENTRTLRS